jgi:hypothetical protein
LTLRWMEEWPQLFLASDILCIQMTFLLTRNVISYGRIITRFLYQS